MSRSKQHSPVHNWRSTNGQKTYRSQENRAKRKKVKQLLTINPESDLPNDKEYGNEWYSPRDGKCWYDSERWKEQGLRYNKWLKK